MKSLIKYLALLIVISLIFVRYGMARSGELFVFAGNDTIVCFATDSVEVFGYAEHYHYVAWEKTGDGFFYDEKHLKTAYVPGPMDIENQQFTLYLIGIANQPIYSRLVDSIHITIVEPPMAYAGQDATICEGDTHQLNGCTGQYSEIFWETSGDGIFSDNQVTNPIYTPGTIDIINGETTLTLQALPNTPCTQPIADVMQLSISKAPYLDAGQDSLICAGSSFQLYAQAEFYDNMYWGTSGDGTFCNNAIANPKYYPGINDINYGLVKLYTLITPYAGCGLYLVDSLSLTIQNLPDANSGPDRTICETEIVQCNAIAENYAEIHWMVFGGNGYFEDPNSLNTIYHPGNQEKTTGLFYINLIVVPAEPCLLPVNSLFQVDVIGQPEIDAGENITVCSEAAVVVEADGENLSAIQWYTSGDGTFENDSMISTNYYPGTADLAQMPIHLWITATGISPCAMQVSDTVTINSAIIEDVYSDITNMELPDGTDLSLYFEVQSPEAGVYQWYFNDAVLENQHDPLLLVTEIVPAQAGFYHCVFDNGCVELSSDTALITVYAAVQQAIVFKEGWNGVSSYIVPLNSNMETVLSPVINDIIILFNEDGIYSPYMDLMTIFEWQHQTGYITKTSAADTLVISGYAKYPAEPIIINSGWSLFSSGCSCNVSVDSLFANQPGISIVKEIGGLGVYWPAKGINTLIHLKPGKAYHIHNSSPDELMLTLPGFNY